MAVWQLCPSCWTKKRMNIPSSAYPAIGAVMAAIIAAGISFLVTVLAKEQKTSEFRQAWIDALRKDLSEFIATVDNAEFVSQAQDEPWSPTRGAGRLPRGEVRRRTADGREPSPDYAAPQPARACDDHRQAGETALDNVVIPEGTG